MADRFTKPPVLYIAQKKEYLPNVSAQSFYYKTEDQVSSNSKKKKSGNRSNFQKFSLQEKLNYLKDMPSIIPKLTCEVSTGNGTYRGIVEEITQEVIVMRNQETLLKEKLLVSTVKDIRLLSF
ncbi:hypothetical protein CEY16_00965 [Halalkalibacillus sediminis]|uniref:Spore coat protein CotO n=1 Tax=Halalkalibacillus sediminis TaxID=2018042 RepID=A0A2I0QW78_9BACI|nr:CotO family spore coat protein [Halalkalibacillus sediminis]PKR78360.1 hypothetical protein CEY16_00965 [Halalkalibacillus sediminis]